MVPCHVKIKDKLILETWTKGLFEAESGQMPQLWQIGYFCGK